MLVIGKYETAENVHIFVEEQIGHQIEFVVLEDVMNKTFDCQTKDGRYDWMLRVHRLCPIRKRV